jgi:hypothetical protein
MEEEMRGTKIVVGVMATVLTVASLSVLAQEEGPILRPKPKPQTATMQIMCDLACNWTLDGAAKGRIDAGASVKAKVIVGQHTVAAETEDALDKVENPVKVKAAGETPVHLWLQPVRDARLKAEQEAKDKADQEARVKAAAQEAQAKADQEARNKAAQEARVKAAQEEQAKAEQEERNKAFLKARDKASQEAQAKAEQTAHDKAVRDEWDREQKERTQVTRERTSGTWSDPATGLMWTGRDNGYALRWQPAVEYCRSLQLGGYSDWRLPSIDELKMIYNPGATVACGQEGHMVCQIKGNIHLTSGVVWSSSGGERPQLMRGFVFRDAGEPRRHVVQLEMSGNNYDRALCVRRSGQ